MSLFVVLKFLCTNNSSFPLFDGLFLDSNASSIFNSNATDMCNEMSYDFEFRFNESTNDSENNTTTNEWIPPFSMCQPNDPALSEIFQDIPTSLVCATAYTGPQECYDNLCTACDPGTYGSSQDTCSECTPGFHSPDPGGTACLMCNPGQIAPFNGTTECEHCLAGTYSAVPGSTACDQCANGTNFSSAPSSSTCLQCSATCPPGTEYQGPCTVSSNTDCARCPRIANCIYTESGECFLVNISTSNCQCVSGFELVDGACQVCRDGFFKNQTSYSPCIPWDDIDSCPPAHYAINGTRFNNSTCIPCPLGPGNSSSVGNRTVCEWRCDDGYCRL